MKAILAAALVAAAALGAAGCRSSSATAGTRTTVYDPNTVDMKIRNYQVIWTRGGKLGYLKTFDVSRPEEKSVRLHYVTDLEFRDVGWIADDGQGERFDYLDPETREARRVAFERVALPVDTIENQIKRIFMVDPGLEIALRPADAVDVQR
jgi:hypothetical protein